MIKLKNYSILVSSNFQMNVNTLEINDSARVFIVGPSGSGKTTLMKALAGLHTEYSGTHEINGEVIVPPTPLYHYGIVFLTQEIGLWPHMTSSEHVAFVMSRGKSLTHDKSMFWLEFVGLKNKAKVKPASLSGGEQKRLALARALSVKPNFLFLDEPFANIDPVLANELMIRIDREHKKSKFTLFKVTHHYFGLKDHNTIIVVVVEGRIIQVGRWIDILQNPKGEWTKKWIELSQKQF